MTQATMTKTAAVRKVLQEIGAVNANPEGWLQKVYDAVASRPGAGDDKTIHHVTVYQIRGKLRKELDGKGVTKNPAKRGPKPKSEKAVAQPASGASLTVQSILEVSEFASKHGGLDALQEVIQAIKTIRG